MCDVKIVAYDSYEPISMLKVTEMKAEYYPPNEEIIIHNESPSEFYIVVSGGVVRYTFNFPTI